MDKKKEMEIIISGTTEYKNKIIKLLVQRKEIINPSEDYKLLCNFILLFVGYQEEITFLQKNEKYISALPLTRISIECYSTIKLLVSLLNNKPILPYDKELTMQLLAFHDICEEITLFYSLKKSERKKDIGIKYMDSIIKDIRTIFDDSFIMRNDSGEVCLNETKKNLIKKLKVKFAQNTIPSNVSIIKAALRNNPLMIYENGDPFNAAQFIYTELSKSCHNTVCSMKDRVEIDIGGIKYSSLNKEHKNNLVYMQVNFNCLCDVYNELKTLFA